jgi:hypothetical protein
VAKKKRKTRVTRANIRKILEDNKNKKLAGSKGSKIVKPGPWTENASKISVNAFLSPSNTIMGSVYGSYIRDPVWSEKGWYPVYVNISSKNIQKEIEEYGIDAYLSACERSLNNSENKKIFGDIVILDIISSFSKNNFISCRAKINRKSAKGFIAVRKNEYKIL